ncbi:MAG: hypothetical protein HYX76_05245 [Acidobacteria bacterium]|nr:hypothetical protein [Acidobacteriota bacterium]
MERSTRQKLLLAVLLVALVAVVWYRLNEPAPLAGAQARPAPAGAAGTSARTTMPPASAVPDVGLDTLSRARPEPVSSNRNPFMLKPKPPPPPPQEATPPGREPLPEIQQPTGPPPPPPPPPIPLKFIGIVNAPSRGGKLAVLSDGRFVYHGKEGDIVEGRYRIVRIGEESIELEHVDGRGRQVIRLSGS